MPADPRLFQLAEFFPGDWRTRSTNLKDLLETATAHLSTDDLEAAEHDLTEAMRWNPASFRLWHLWSELYRKRGDREGQIFAQETAIGVCTEFEEKAKSLQTLEELTGREYESCDTCGQFGTFKGHYKIHKDEMKCPRCLGKSMRKKAGISARVYGLGILALILLGPATLLVGGWALAFLLTNYMLMVVFMLGVIPLHEAAHALTALALKGEVLWIQIGLGPQLMAYDFRGVRISVHQFFILGMTYFGFPSPDRIRLRHFLAIMVGPLLHLGLFLLCLPGVAWERLFTTVAWQETFLFANLIMFLSSAVPSSRLRGLADAATDGTQLILILRGKLTAHMIHVAFFLTKGLLIGKTRNFSRTLATMEEGLEYYPDEPALLTNRAIYLGAVDRYEEAVHALETVLDKEAGSQHAETEPGALISMALNQLLIRNALAYYRAIKGITGFDSRHTVTSTLENFHQAPWLTPLASTLGSSLVVGGYPAQGLMYLEFSKRHPQLPEEPPSAEILAWIALAQQRMGLSVRARRSLDRARALNPDDHIVRRVTPEIEGPTRDTPAN